MCELGRGGGSADALCVKSMAHPEANVALATPQEALRLLAQAGQEHTLCLCELYAHCAFELS